MAVCGFITHINKLYDSLPKQEAKVEARKTLKNNL